MNILLLALGGGLGAITRYLCGLFIMKRFPQPSIPVAMLLVNLTGSLGLGLFLGLLYEGVPLGAYEEPFFLLVAIGFFGAYTTFSTFSMEASELIRKRLYKKLVAYVSLSIFGSILFFCVGLLSGIHIG
ncbi:fluoride efflux transporter CrcB [Bacillus sp. FJAT-45350]|uniref:fluoride efflux transporter CrcB n=1 Tax=Bacillus sp. FJAT-45350 TaxID=2011014 RepID=UPI000BB7A9DD|nr:fluoride efflux transporter CrcB [Bacillus sp. FJAT-45350]